jgi:hypothetical protein
VHHALNKAAGTPSAVAPVILAITGDSSAELAPDGSPLTSLTGQAESLFDVVLIKPVLLEDLHAALQRLLPKRVPALVKNRRRVVG